MAVLGRLGEDFPNSEIKGISFNTPGVYRIYMENGKSYIGISTCLRKRLLKHNRQLINNNHFNPKLQNAFNLHSANSFYAEILYTYHADISDKDLLISECCFMKQYQALDKNLGFNIKPTDINGQIRHTEEHKIYMSKVLTGKKKSAKHCENIKKVRKLQVGHKHTE